MKMKNKIIIGILLFVLGIFISESSAGYFKKTPSWMSSTSGYPYIHDIYDALLESEHDWINSPAEDGVYIGEMGGNDYSYQGTWPSICAGHVDAGAGEPGEITNLKNVKTITLNEYNIDCSMDLLFAKLLREHDSEGIHYFLSIHAGQYTGDTYGSKEPKPGKPTDYDAKAAEADRLFNTRLEHGDSSPSKAVINGKTYIGPYNITSTGGGLESITINTSKGKLKATQYIIGKNAIGKEESIENISSGKDIDKKNFYVVYDGEIKGKINSIELEKHTTGYRGQIALCYAKSDGGQTLGLYGGEEYQKELTTTLDGIPTSEITIIKKDSVDYTAKMGKVKIMVYVQGKNDSGWVTGKFNSDGERTLAKNMKKAKEKDGVFSSTQTIDRLAVEGTYSFYEIERQNNFYDFVSIDNPIYLGSIDVSLGESKEITLTNEKKFFHLRFIKKDSKTGEELKNVRFVVQYEDGKYITGTNETEAQYVESIYDARQYKTQQKVANLTKLGTYTVWEVQEESDKYEPASIESPIKLKEVKIDHIGELYEFELFNTPTYSHASLKKVDKDTGNELKNVEFIIEYKDHPGWYVSTSYTPPYTSHKDRATRFKSGDEVRKLTLEGTYILWEVQAENDLYEPATFDNPIKLAEQKIEMGNDYTIELNNEKEVLDIGITKRDPNHNNRELTNVRFIVQYGNQYVVKATSNDKRATYTDDINQATWFKTGDIIKNLPNEGTYKFYEVQRENDKYAFASLDAPLYAGSIYVTLDSNKEFSIVMDNTEIFTHGEITKVDHNTKVELKNAVFIVQHKDSGLYVKTEPDKPATYTSNKAEASTYRSGDSLSNLTKEGTYIFWEIEAESDCYESASLENPLKVAEYEFKIGTDVKAEIENKEIVMHIPIYKQDVETSEELKNTEFIVKYGDEYVVKPAGERKAATYTSDITKASIYKAGETVGRLPKKGIYKFYEVTRENDKYDFASISKSIYVGKIDMEEFGATTTITLNNKKKFSHLQLYKRDEYVDQELKNARFIVQYVPTGEYLKTQIDQDAVYTTNKSEATWFKSGDKVPNLTRAGKYRILEVQNENKYYLDASLSSPLVISEFDVSIGLDIPVTLTNRREYVDLSGMVWEDIQPIGKTVKDRNNRYKLDSNDINDKLLEGIRVQLKNMATGGVIATDTTDSNGKYFFDRVRIDELKNYYIEFQYNGMSYENVDPHLTEDKGSKAIEQDNRTTFNNQYATIVKGGARSTSNSFRELRYTTQNYEGHVIYGENNLLNYGYQGNTQPVSGVYDHFYIESDTRKAFGGGLNLYRSEETIRQNAMNEVENLNLGLYKRLQPDLAIGKELESVRVTLNGQEHTYNYTSLSDNDSRYRLEPSVKFGEKYGDSSYTRALYPADVAYTGEEKLKVYATYRITVTNTTADFTTTIHDIVDYYDSKYNLSHIRTEDGSEITSISNINTGNAQYNGVRISTDISLEGNTQKSIYIELEVQQDKIIDIIAQNQQSEEENMVKLDNIAEIASYSTTKDGSVYAAIDQDSQPESLVLGNINTYEDDTDNAPGLKLVLQSERKVTGFVFVDKTSNELQVNAERQGNGQYDTNEPVVKGVTVRLVDPTTKQSINVYRQTGSTIKNGEWIPGQSTTKDDGVYEISGMIPGNYQLQFEWGGQTYMLDNNTNELIRVQDYKGTIYKDKDRQNQIEWYRTTTPRYSDAMDDIAQRKAIDEQTKNATNASQEAITQYNEESTINGQPLIRTMQSNTPTFRVNLEYNSEPINAKEEYMLNSDGTIKMDGIYATRMPTFENIIKNIDFGVVKRPEQLLELSKRITNARLTLANGILLIDAKVIQKPDGTIELEHAVNDTVYLKESPMHPAQLKLELDNEVTQGATLEIGYELQVTNKSELDYIDDTYSYYLYGIQGPNSKLVTLKANKVIDYIDNDISTENIDAEGWSEITRGDKNQLITKGLLSSDLQEILDKTNKLVMSKEELFKELAPGDQLDNAIPLTGKRLVTNKDEIVINNYAEIIETTKTGGSSIQTTPGNYNYAKQETHESDDSSAEELIITPPTGLTTDIVLYTVIAIVALGVVATGIILIKKYAIRK